MFSFKESERQGRGHLARDSKAGARIGKIVSEERWKLHISVSEERWMLHVTMVVLNLTGAREG